MGFDREYNNIRPLSPHLVSLIGDKNEVNILDVGSGPYPITGQYLEGVHVNMTYCDKTNFPEFWRRAKVAPVFLVEIQNMENLTYPDSMFDIVNCVNALDHTKKALEAIQEMERVCKIGGWVYIDCYLNQLETGYRHFWNARSNGILENNKGVIDLKKLGFIIKFIDLGGNDRYSHIIATKQK